MNKLSEDKLAKVHYLSPIKVGNYIRFRHNRDKDYQLGFVSGIDAALPYRKSDKVGFIYYVCTIITNGFLSARTSRIYSTHYDIKVIDPESAGLKVKRICPRTGALCRDFTRLCINGKDFDQYKCDGQKGWYCDYHSLKDNPIPQIPTELTLEELLKDEITETLNYESKKKEEWKEYERKRKLDQEYADSIMNRVTEDLGLEGNLIKFNDGIKSVSDKWTRYSPNINQLYKLTRSYCYGRNTKEVTLNFDKVNLDLTTTNDSIILTIFEGYYSSKIEQLKKCIKLYPINRKYLRGNYCYLMDKPCDFCKKHECIKRVTSPDQCID